MCKSWNSILWYSLVLGFAIDDGLHYVWLQVYVAGHSVFESFHVLSVREFKSSR